MIVWILHSTLVLYLTGFSEGNDEDDEDELSAFCTDAKYFFVAAVIDFGGIGDLHMGHVLNPDLSTFSMHSLQNK